MNAVAIAINKTLLAVFITAFTISCNSGPAQSDCAKFKTGKFVIHNRQMGDILVERTNTHQIEKMAQSGTAVALEVRWINDCEYQLSFRSQETGPGDTSNYNGNTVTTTITKTAADYYVFSTRSEGIEGTYRDTAFRVK